MKIVVLVKEVPDTYAERKLNLETGLADRDANDRVLDEITERATEAALTLSDAAKSAGDTDTEVTVMTLGPETAPTAMRKALAMGADKAVHITDPAFLGADLTLTAEALAAAIKNNGFDLVITGDASTDGNAAAIPAMVAEHLEVPSLSRLTAVELHEGKVTGSREADGGIQQVSAPLPAVVSITEQLPDARFPNFKGIVAAKKKPVETLSLGDLGVSAGVEIPRSIMLAVSEKPPREAGVKIVDEGDAGQRLAAFLKENKLV